MKVIFSKDYQDRQKEILGFIKNFDSGGEKVPGGSRNRIKAFDLNGKKINIKSFKIPNTVNKVVYRFFRRSKAERSFSYAQELISRGIGTPQAVAFAESHSAVVFKDSYYVSEHLPYDLTFRELVTEPDLPGHEDILRGFTRFTWKLHEQEVEFLDHSPGNTLIQMNNGDYRFFLVDLNRMNFRKLNFTERMKNFSRLTPKEEMIRIMANEYSRLSGRPEAEVFEKMWFFTRQFQHKFHRKQRLKKKLKFWKQD